MKAAPRSWVFALVLCLSLRHAEGTHNRSAPPSQLTGELKQMVPNLAHWDALARTPASGSYTAPSRTGHGTILC